MRADMSKVLVEEPRWGRATARALAGSRRLRRNRLDADGEGGPARRGKAPGGSNSIGEPLGPLYRYLRGQVDRPWDKVYGELCAALDRRSVVQAHLFQHIDDQVDIDTVWHDGQVQVRRWRGLVPLSESQAELYVHPRTGLLLVRAHPARARAHDRVVGAPLPADVQWHRIDGQWYELRLRTLAGGAAGFDVVLRREVTTQDRELLHRRYGGAAVYAQAKRQLDGRTLRRHGLATA
jgi:hypothetical protein